MKRFILILLSSFVIVLFIAVILVLGMRNQFGDNGYAGKIKLSRDDLRMSDIHKLADILDKERGMNFAMFKDFQDINKHFGTNFTDPKTCYYFTSIKNGEGFVLATKLESKVNIEKYSSEFFIIKKPQLYDLDTSIMSDIKSVTSLICKNAN